MRGKVLNALTRPLVTLTVKLKASFQGAKLGTQPWQCAMSGAVRPRE